MPAYRIRVAGSAERGLARLPEASAAAVVRFLLDDLGEAPKRVGHPLREELARLWSARRGPYRIVYEVD